MFKISLIFLSIQKTLFIVLIYTWYNINTILIQINFHRYINFLARNLLASFKSPGFNKLLKKSSLTDFRPPSSAIKANAPSSVYPSTSTHTPKLANNPGVLVDVAVLQLQQQHSNSAPLTEALILNASAFAFAFLPGQHLGALW